MTLGEYILLWEEKASTSGNDLTIILDGSSLELKKYKVDKTFSGTSNNITAKQVNVDQLVSSTINQHLNDALSDIQNARDQKLSEINQ